MNILKGRRLLEACAVVLMLAGMTAGFISASACKSAPRDLRCNHYSVQVSLDPPHQFIRASVLLRLKTPSDGLDRLTFFLHRQLKIASVTGPGIAGFEVIPTLEGEAPFMPEADAVVVKLDRKSQKGRCGISAISLWRRRHEMARLVRKPHFQGLDGNRDVLSVVPLQSGLRRS